MRGMRYLPLVLAFAVLVPTASAWAQSFGTHPPLPPINDSIRAITLRNEKAYRLLNAMDDKGSSYEFTNVTAWKITDDNLTNQIENLYTSKYPKQLKNFEINNVYVFVAPDGLDQAGDEKFFPFHILFMGKHINVDTSGEGGGGFFGGGGGNTNQTVPIAFKGQQVVPLMLHDPSLVDQINAIQGNLVEMPAGIAPRGVQLIKNADERYIFHEMFTGFYSKRMIIDQQDLTLGIPTSDEMMLPADTSAPTTPQIPWGPDETQTLSIESLNSQAFRYQKTIDLSIDHLTANITRTDALELQIGNPEVGLPFWSSGEARLWLTMKNQIGTESDFQIGVDFPNFGLGNVNHAIFQPRKLSGFWGGSMAGYFAGIDFFSAFNMPLAFNFSVFPGGGSNSSIIYNGVAGSVPTPVDPAHSTVPEGQTFYRTSFIGQMYIPFIVQLDPANFVQFSAGVGIDMVKLSWIPQSDSEAEAFGYGPGQGGTVQDLLYNGRSNVSTPFTPHVAIDYVNHRANKFGLDFQYDHLFTFGGWLELIPDHLRIEASYTAPLVRAALPYEPPYFFEITPRLYF